MTTSSNNSPLTMRSVQGDYFLTLADQLGTGWARMIASYFDTNQPSEEYPWLRSAPALRKWEGERSFVEIATDKVTIFNDEYETGFSVKVKDFRRDKTTQIQARIADLARRVAQHPESLLTALLVANGNAYDGVSFFSTSRTVGASGTIKNDIGTSDGLAGGAAPTTAQMASNLLISLQQMLGFKDDKGEPLNEGARQFLVMTPANLWGATVAAINAAFTSASATNPIPELRGQGVQFTPVLNARLTATNTFYVARADAGIKSMLLQEEETNPVALDRDSEHAIKKNEVYFGHGWSGGVGYGRPELILRGATS